MNCTINPTQRICRELLRFEKWCDIINLTNLNLKETVHYENDAHNHPNSKFQ